LTVMSLLGGLVIYGYLGMYPTFLREGLGYSPSTTGLVVSLYGFGALTSIGGGSIGDRGSPRVVLSTSFVVAAVLAFVPANDMPFNSRTEVLVGSAVMLALCLIVVVVLAVARWRRRRRVRQTCWRATYLTVGLSAAELDGFHDEQHGADDEVAA